ncbi:MAG: hypothetical protein AAB504_02855 [Patescibacteria group bacterium]
MSKENNQEIVLGIKCSKCGKGVKEEIALDAGDLHKLKCVFCDNYAYVGNNFHGVEI